ncbi:DNA-binding transcriptional ArsR family regulator [Kitasatospora sp. GP30]|uniref:ArsR/SmtB family transcription factor n=1 Tax=Kitasatospora sp. GP30 TaxID=3035084 RepID=UPI000CA6CAD9|nr:metalloregulator ArsR/SmtB family transcription factor [Kitasatospora sp. GP30]MDH6143911.1 DNA-binding transcriptional ArsR family regulator [Kitasatospora sp. GP30]
MTEATTTTRLPEPATDDIRLAAVLHALADPVRLQIVRQLADGHQDMACIAFSLPVSKSTTTHHFRVLREAGVIRQHRRGTSRVSTLRTADLEQTLPGLLDRVLVAARAEALRHPMDPPSDAPTME